MAVDAMATPRAVFDSEHKDYRESFRHFLEQEVVPNYQEWQKAGTFDRAIFPTAAQQGFVAMQVPERLDGLGIDDLRFSIVLAEEAAEAGVAAFGLALGAHNDLGVPLLLAGSEADTDLQALASGRLLSATITDAQSVQAQAGSDGWRIQGGASTVVGASVADVLVVLLPDGDAATLVAIPTTTRGVRVAPADARIGMRACPVGHVVLEDVRLPFSAALGPRHTGADVLAPELARRRLTLGATALGLSRSALRWTVEYVRDRRAFGQAIASFENTRLMLGDAVARIDASELVLDAALADAGAGRLDPRRASVAKLACTTALAAVVDCGVQLHGGYGYMLEYPIAHAYVDARMLRLLGGSDEELRLMVAAAAGVSL